MTDLETAFLAAPIGIVLAKQRVIQTCNHQFAAMLGFERTELEGRSFRMLYNSQDEFEQVRDIGSHQLKSAGHYADERMMRHKNGQAVWCRFRARTLTPEDVLAKVIMSFAGISESGNAQQLSKRQREVIGLMRMGFTSKKIARELGLSPRTVEDIRGRLYRKFNVGNAAELILKFSG